LGLFAGLLPTPMKRLPRLGYPACFWLGLVGVIFGLASPASADCGWPAGAVRVVDVDERLDIALSDGRLVRLGGLDLPRPERGDPEIVRAARDFLAVRLVGRTVVLDLFANQPDRWDRMVGDLSGPAIADGPAGSAQSIATAVLRAGYGRVRPEFETRGCALSRLADEEEARRGGLGIWRDPEYAVIPSYEAETLSRRDGQFVVIEGRVRRVGFGRSYLYLDLVPYDGPTIVVARKLQKVFAGAGRPVEALAGLTIRARGVLDDRFGPRIEVDEPAMIEVLRRPDARGAGKPH
jgi:endonuclease YncB( thermonuclease family)